MPISSSVSRQSATNAGQNTATFFTPRSASLTISSSVYGWIHGVRPRRDWNVIVLFVSSRPSRSRRPRVVAKHCAR